MGLGSDGHEELMETVMMGRGFVSEFRRHEWCFDGEFVVALSRGDVEKHPRGHCAGADLGATQGESLSGKVVTLP